MNSKSNSVKGSYMERTNADILRVLSVALRQKAHTEILSDVSILKVDASKDLSTARVYISTQSNIRQEIVLSELNKLNGFFRNEIAQNIKIRRVPNLRFIVDEGSKNVNRVEELLQQISRTSSGSNIEN